MVMRTSKASAADGHSTKRCINVKPARYTVDRVASDRREGNPVATATLENQFHFAGAFRESGLTVFGNTAPEHAITVAIDATSATVTDPCVAISQAAVPPAHMAPVM